jgi:hypothetical protein
MFHAQYLNKARHSGNQKATHSGGGMGRCHGIQNGELLLRFAIPVIAVVVIVAVVAVIT